MSDAEVICGWMEPKPTKSWLEGYRPFDPSSPPCPWNWWQWDGLASIYGGAARPVALTLDRLHEVEERLTRDQQTAYMKALDRATFWQFLHLEASKKIKALAEVLRTK